MLPLKESHLKPVEQPPQWKIGVDRNQVVFYVGLALVAGFAVGYFVAIQMTPNSNPTSAERRAAETERPVPASSPAGRVTRIVRADTIDVEGIGTVRLIGVETPDGKAPEEIYRGHGQNALSFTEKALIGQEVKLRFDPNFEATGNKNQDGSLMAYVYTSDGSLFNAELVKQGHAFAQVREPFSFIDQFRTLERDAMQAMRGLWGLSGSPTVAASVEPSGSAPTSLEGKTRRLTPLAPSELGPNVPTLSGPVSSSEEFVFVSSADRMYHKSGCDFLAKNRNSIPLSQSRAQGYTACSKCFASTVLRAP